MSRTNFDTLLEAGCHFGHLKRKWNPAMAPYIFMERNGIHIIDLHKTVAKVDEAADALKQIAKSGKKVLFVVIKQVYETQGHMYENILIPITDGKRMYNISCNLKRAYETECKEVVKLSLIHI